MDRRPDPTTKDVRQGDLTASGAEGPLGHNELLGEQIHALYLKGVLALVANLVVGALLIVALRGTISASAALIWWAVMAFVVGVRLAIWRRYCVLARGPERARLDPRVWGRRWVVGTAITGMIWGSAAVWLYPMSAAGQVVFISTFAGMAAGVSTSALSYLPAFHAFVIPELTPLLLRLAAQHTSPRMGLAAMVVLFGFAMYLVARRGNRVLLDAIRLRFWNARLVADLSEAQQGLITFNRELEERVAARTQELQQAIAAREMILSLVSHELRTPLMTMNLTERALLKQMETGEVPPRFRDVCFRFGRQTRRLLYLVNQMLDLGQLRKGGITLNPEAVRVEELVELAKEDLLPLASEGEKEAKVDIRLEGDLVGHWDRQRMVQVLVNLLSNALKYGGGKPVRVRGKRLDDRVQISVFNEGHGIAKQDLERIFEPFERAEGGSKATGYGLGLFIAKRVVDAHGGRLWARERPLNAGAEFVIELPGLLPGPEEARV